MQPFPGILPVHNIWFFLKLREPKTTFHIQKCCFPRLSGRNIGKKTFHTKNVSLFGGSLPVLSLGSVLAVCCLYLLRGSFLGHCSTLIHIRLLKVFPSCVNVNSFVFRAGCKVPHCQKWNCHTPHFLLSIEPFRDFIQQQARPKRNGLCKPHTCQQRVQPRI